MYRLHAINRGIKQSTAATIIHTHCELRGSITGNCILDLHRRMHINPRLKHSPSSETRAEVRSPIYHLSTLTIGYL